MDKEQFQAQPGLSGFLFSSQGAISTLQVKAVTGRRVWNVLSTLCLRCVNSWTPLQAAPTFPKQRAKKCPKGSRGAGGRFLGGHREVTTPPASQAPRSSQSCSLHPLWALSFTPGTTLALSSSRGSAHPPSQPIQSILFSPKKRVRSSSSPWKRGEESAAHGY